MNNPVYRREMTVSARNSRAPLAIFIFNAVLAAFTLFNMYRAVAQMKIIGQVQYSYFLNLYAFTATAEFMLLLFITPSLTAAGISGERERGTLDLLFTTKMGAADIVAGKLAAALSQLAVLIISGIPVFLLNFVYGGVGMYDLVLLSACFAITAFFCSATGILFSAALNRSSLSAALSYGLLIVIVAGTLLINRFSLSMSAMQAEGAAGLAGTETAVYDSGPVAYTLLLNPLVTFSEIIGRQVPDANRLFSLDSFLGERAGTFFGRHWVAVSLVLQLAVSLLAVYFAVRFVKPRGMRDRHDKDGGYPETGAA